jgi:hypothetical protein
MNGGVGVPLRCAPGRAARAVGNDTTVANGAEPPALTSGRAFPRRPCMRAGVSALRARIPHANGGWASGVGALRYASNCAPQGPPLLRCAGTRGEFDLAATSFRAVLPPPRSLRGRVGEGGGSPSRAASTGGARTLRPTQPPPTVSGEVGRWCRARRGPAPAPPKRSGPLQQGPHTNLLTSHGTLAILCAPSQPSRHTAATSS